MDFVPFWMDLEWADVHDILGLGRGFKRFLNVCFAPTKIIWKIIQYFDLRICFDRVARPPTPVYFLESKDHCFRLTCPKRPCDPRKIPWLVGLYKGLYYPVILGIYNKRL